MPHLNGGKKWGVPGWPTGCYAGHRGKSSEYGSLKQENTSVTVDSRPNMAPYTVEEKNTEANVDSRPNMYGSLEEKTSYCTVDIRPITAPLDVKILNLLLIFVRIRLPCT